MLYSAHDWSVINVFLALGVELGRWPPFASHLVVELYKDMDAMTTTATATTTTTTTTAGGHVVRVLFNDEVLLLGDSEDGYVSVEKFLDMLEMYRVKDAEEACAL